MLLKNDTSIPSLTKDTRNNRQWIYGLLLVGSLIGLLASFVLSVEAIEIVRNRDVVLSCDLNSIVSCGAVARDPSAQVLGFPNSFLGMMTLPVMVTVAVAGLSGVVFPRWFMKGAFLGAIGGLLFAGWMFYMSYVVIRALCPWCLTLDLGMVMVFFALLRYQALEQNFYSKNALTKKLRELVKKDYDRVAMVGLVVLIVAMILIKYGSEL